MKCFIEDILLLKAAIKQDIVDYIFNDENNDFQIIVFFLDSIF